MRARLLTAIAIIIGVNWIFFGFSAGNGGGLIFGLPIIGVGVVYFGRKIQRDHETALGDHSDPDGESVSNEETDNQQILSKFSVRNFVITLAIGIAVLLAVGIFHEKSTSNSLESHYSINYSQFSKAIEGQPTAQLNTFSCKYAELWLYLGMQGDAANPTKGAISYANAKNLSTNLAQLSAHTTDPLHAWLVLVAADLGRPMDKVAALNSNAHNDSQPLTSHVDSLIRICDKQSK